MIDLLLVPECTLASSSKTLSTLSSWSELGGEDSDWSRDLRLRVARQKRPKSPDSIDRRWRGAEEAVSRSKEELELQEVAIIVYQTAPTNQEVFSL